MILGDADLLAKSNGILRMAGMAIYWHDIIPVTVGCPALSSASVLLTGRIQESAKPGWGRLVPTSSVFVGKDRGQAVPAPVLEFALRQICGFPTGVISRN
jgi:hypothetical protein